MTMTEQQKISNDALSMWLDENHAGKWERHFGTWDSIEWKDGVTKPAKSTYTSVQDAYEKKSSAYFKREYPPIQEQLDDIYHNGIDGWKATIKAIKDKHPKGD